MARTNMLVFSLLLLPLCALAQTSTTTSSSVNFASHSDESEPIYDSARRSAFTSPPEAPAPPGNKVYTYVEQMPVTSYDINKYLNENLHYPEEASRKNIEGRVIVKFVVNEDGHISDCTVIRGIGGGCDEEAKRVVIAMPPWTPGKQNGKPVGVYYTLPIVFKLTGKR